MRKISLWAVFLTFLCMGYARAQGIPIGALPNATTPLTGSELTIISQNGVTKKATISQVLVPGTTIAANTILGNNTGITAPATGLTASQVDSLLGLGTAAFANLGSSGATVPILNAINTWSGLQTFNGGITVTGPVTIGSVVVNGTLGVTGTTSLGTGFTNFVTVAGSAGSPTIATNGGNLSLAPVGGGVSVTGQLFASSTFQDTGGSIISGSAANVRGTISLFDNAVHTIVIQPPNPTASYTITLPATAGISGQPLLSAGGGPTAMTYGTLSGNTSAFVTTTGAQTSGNCVNIDVNGNHVAAGAACILSGGSAALTTVTATSLALNGAVIGTNALAFSGSAIGTSLALNGASIGTNALAATGTMNISGTSSLGTGSTDFITAAGGGAGGTLSTNAGAITLSSGGGASTTLSDSLVVLSNAAYHTCGALTTNSSGNIVCSAAATYIAWGGIKTVAFNATSNTGYCVDTLTTGAVTMTLPASPADGDKVQFIDCKSNFGTTNLTVARNSKNIMGLAQDMTVNTTNATSILTYNLSTTDWRLN